MKYTCIAALALAWATFAPASANAHASNCTAFNGPYCKLAHDVRHHGAQLPMVWAQPNYYQPYYSGYSGTQGYPYQNYYQNSLYTGSGYTTPYYNTGYSGGYGIGYGGGYGGGYGTTCGIQVPTTCNYGYGSSYYGGY